MTLVGKKIKKSLHTVLSFRRELNILAFQPWTNLEIRKSVDQAINEVNILLNPRKLCLW